MPKGSPKTFRNEEIIAFVKANDWSYQLVGDHFGISRNVVAGLMFRDRHPRDKLVNSPKGCRNKTGTGYQHRSYWPAYTAQTHQV